MLFKKSDMAVLVSATKKSYFSSYSAFVVSVDVSPDSMMYELSVKSESSLIVILQFLSVVALLNVLSIFCCNVATVGSTVVS